MADVAKRGCLLKANQPLLHGSLAEMIIPYLRFEVIHPCRGDNCVTNDVNWYEIHHQVAVTHNTRYRSS